MKRKYIRQAKGLAREISSVKFYVMLAMAFFIIGYFSGIVKMLWGGSA